MKVKSNNIILHYQVRVEDIDGQYITTYHRTHEEMVEYVMSIHRRNPDCNMTIHAIADPDYDKR